MTAEYYKIQSKLDTKCNRLVILVAGLAIACGALTYLVNQISQDHVIVYLDKNATYLRIRVVIALLADTSDLGAILPPQTLLE